MSLIDRVKSNEIDLYRRTADLRRRLDRLDRRSKLLAAQVNDPLLAGRHVPSTLMAAQSVLVEIISVSGGIGGGRAMMAEVTEDDLWIDLVGDDEDDRPYTIVLYPFGLRAFIGCRCEIAPLFEHRQMVGETETFTAYWRCVACEGDGFRAVIEYADPEDIEFVPSGPLAGVPLYPWTQAPGESPPARPHLLHWEKAVGPEERPLGKAMWYAPGFDPLQEPRRLIPSGTPVTIRHEPALSNGGYAALIFTEVIEPESRLC